MKTLTTITAITYSPGLSYESTHHFIRAYSAKKPTYLGAARMVANKYNDNRFDESIPKIKPLDISVSRIEICDMA